MKISSRFTVAVHMLICVEYFSEQYKITSDFLSKSVRTNPVVIRKIMGMLKNHGLIEVASGTGGIHLKIPSDELTLLDIYQAVALPEDQLLFSMHENTEPLCPVGRNITAVLSPALQKAQHTMEESLQRTTLSELIYDLKERVEEETAPNE